MNLVASPEAPLLIRSAATTILVLHIAGGTAGIASGFTAILARKGGRLHRTAGTVFFVAMLTMTVIAATVSPLLSENQWTNTTAGVFTLYLVITGWLAIRRRPGEVGRIETFAVIAPLGIAGMAVTLAILNTGKPGAGDFATVYAIAAVATLAAVCDLRMIRCGGIVGPARIARHLWRLTTALFVATGSFFMGQQKFLPEAIRGTIVPVIPVIAVLVLLAFWMMRTRLRWPTLRRPAAA